MQAVAEASTRKRNEHFLTPAGMKNLRRWCPNLETAVDGNPMARSDAAPEHLRMAFASVAGRRWQQKNHWVPLGLREPEKTAPAKEATEAAPKEMNQEEQLLYLAVYRDKIAQQQAALQDPEGTSPWQQRRERQNYGQVVDDHLRLFGRPASTPPVTAERAADANSSEQQAARRGPSKAPLTARGASARASHVAAVSTRHVSGGATLEHFEDKRLGKLFEEWRESEDAKEAFERQAKSKKTARAGGRHARGGLINVPSPGPAASASLRVDLNVPKLGEDLDDDDIDLMSCPDLSKMKESHERRNVKAERLISVMTNPKARLQSFADKAARPDQLRAAAATHIEGFPPLMLEKLYKGPWRLDA
eukprot:TRINITY_DN22998_c0_g1_i1.p1 TRINITY_DN22998_c0_g1~~TRINITY_DN22998_c0_g1_i1.p1  ORF type:complete len:362 (-),score=89.43 TRINITY_DN22998_c0_g1_i1:154-1239(-)